MKSVGKISLFIVVLGIILSACNLPVPGSGASADTEQQESQVSPQDLAMTIVAQTATAEALAATPTASLTPVPSAPTVSVSVATNCRTGPDAAYELLMVVQPGGSMQVVGKYSAGNYWIINMPTGGTCWLWGQYATVTGDTSSLPEIAAPAPPVAAQPPASNNSNSNSSDSNNSNDSSNSNNSNSNPQVIVPLVPIVILAPPAAPTNVDITRQCKDLTKPGDLFKTFEQTTQFTWTDASNNETGFNVFKDGAQVANFSAGTQKYIDTFVVLLPQSPTVTYGVQAVNSGGASATVTAAVKYCQ